MNVFDQALSLIELGRSNVIMSVPTRIPKLDEFIYGVRQGCYYLFGGETGTGKTTIAREVFMHVLYEYYKLIGDPKLFDVEFVDFSLEISAAINMGSALTRRIYLDYDTVLPVDQIFGWKTDVPKLSDEAYRLIASYREYFKDYVSKLNVVDEETTPTTLHDKLMEVAKKNGTFSKEGRWIWECGTYTPRNPRLFVVALVDTVNLADVEPGSDFLKAAIDKISRICVWFRNKCNFTIVVIQQFNAEISSTDRSRYGVSTPMLRDFEDSKRTTKDANIVVGLYDPVRHLKEDNDWFRGYNVLQLKGWIRTLHILKNRNGQANKTVALRFAGATGTFTQLPEPGDLTTEDYAKLTRY